jgi:hypothetical protein
MFVPLNSIAWYTYQTNNQSWVIGLTEGLLLELQKC